MNYPLISEYIEAIKSAEDNFEELSYVRPVLGDDGLPVMTSGNFAVVFKMKDEQSGKFYAVKCFTKEQEGRAEAYREIAKELENVSSPYILSIRYLDKELFVDTDQTIETEFPVLLMDWVEGKTLDKYLRENLDDKYALEMLAYRFSQLAQWLIPQPFAHGDLKPDNILVREDGTLVLVDYDGMYVPAMKGQKARELGSPDFRHPLRTENDFDEHIDDFPLVSILLSLKSISIFPQLLDKYGATDRLLLSYRDYSNISESKILKELYPSLDSELNVIISLFIIVFERKALYNMPSCLFRLCRPMTEDEIDAYNTMWEEEYAPHEIIKSWTYQEFADGFDEIDVSYAYYPVREDVENACYFKRHNGEEVIVYNLNRLTSEQIREQRNKLEVTLMKSGHYVLLYKNTSVKNKRLDYDTKVTEEELANAWIDDFGVKYSADKKKLLKGPTEENRRGYHVWNKSILNGSYSILQGTVSICDKAFINCRDLITVYLPNSVKRIGNSSFSNCSGLMYLKLNEGLLEIGNEAFKNCKSLVHVLIPESLINIGDDVFEGSSICRISTFKGDKKRVQSLLPNHKDMIEELPY